MIPAARYAWLAQYLRQRGNDALPAVALLGENTLRNVFLHAQDAQRDADAHRRWRELQLREFALALRGDEIVLPGFASLASDRFDAEDIVRLFTARYGLGRVPAKERRSYVAWDAKWLVSFGDYENVYCYADAAVTELLAIDARAATISRVASMRGDKPGPCVSRREWLGGERLVLK